MSSSNKKDNDYYRHLIVNHYSNPINRGLLKNRDSVTFHHVSNSCVDDFYIELTFNNKDIITAVRFEGIGCAISSAAIDIFELLIINESIKEVMKINNNYQDMLKGEKYDEKILQSLIAFKNVLKQPSRVKCALIISEAINEIFLIKQGKDN